MIILKNRERMGVDMEKKFGFKVSVNIKKKRN